MKLRFWRWTLSHEILILVAVSILAAQAAGLVVLLTFPRRPLGAVAMEEALPRIKDAVRHVGKAQSDADAAELARDASDRRLQFSVASQPPPTLQDPISARLADLMVQGLGVAPQDVRVVEMGPFRGRRFLRQLQAGDGGPAIVVQGDGFGQPSAAAPDGPDTVYVGPRPGSDEPPPPPPDEAGPPEGVPRGSPPRDGGVNQALDRALNAQRPPFVVRRRGSAGPGDIRLFPLGRRGLAVKAGSRWLLVRGQPATAESVWLKQVGLTFGLTLAALLLPALWIGYRLARRIGGFAEAADRFGRNPDAPQLPVQGPYELRQAAGAFNRMQARIQRLVSDRTMMMAAVSHDLRTPLARVRFRINELEPGVRDAIAEDIQQMDELITQMLSFTRDALPNAERRKFDLSALAQSLVDDLADAGGEVTFSGPEKLTVEANLAAVRRVLGNLLDNALKFAGGACLELKVQDDMALAIVEDHGPGVPAGMEEAIFEPFRRLEPSRNRKTGGVGLGLAIARNLARGHGGDVVLEPVQPHGARFVFSLPLA